MEQILPFSEVNIVENRKVVVVTLNASFDNNIISVVICMENDDVEMEVNPKKSSLQLIFYDKNMMVFFNYYTFFWMKKIKVF